VCTTDVVLRHVVAVHLDPLDDERREAENGSSPQQQSEAADQSAAELDQLGRGRWRREFIQSVRHQSVSSLRLRHSLQCAPARPPAINARAHSQTDGANVT